jgi:hypothetical protein
VVTEEWRKAHNKELCYIFSSPNIVRVIKSGRMRCSGHVARMGERKEVYKVLLGIPVIKRSLGGRRRRWEGYIKTDP